MTLVRIVSLVPSLTKTLVDAGHRDLLIGCTPFCIDPPDLGRSMTLVGGTKDPNISLIQSLSPTHVLLNEEENRLEDARALEEFCEIVTTFPKSPQDVLGMFDQLSERLGLESSFEPLKKELQAELDQIPQDPPHVGSYLYLIWKKPWMAAGPQTYIDELLRLYGLTNVLADGDRYPALSEAQLGELRGDFIFLSSEPYPFRYRDLPDLLPLLEGDPKVFKIDGKLLSWYGSLTIEALKAMRIWTECEFKDGELATLMRPEKVNR